MAKAIGCFSLVRCAEAQSYKDDIRSTKNNPVLQDGAKQ
jgi:hypothetical protein